jgi:Flp pilus assembly pilin Flp
MRNLAPGALTREEFMRRLMTLLRCERGANAIEFALVATLIAIAAYAAFIALGDKLNIIYSNVENQMPSN